MTSYEFEKKAKAAVVKVMAEEKGVQVTLEELELVWFAHELGNKKCTLYAPSLGEYYPEVTFNKETGEMYVDVYKKEFKRTFKM